MKIIGTIAITVGAFLPALPTANAAPSPCTPGNPVPAYSVFGSVCTGYGTQCSMGMTNCSPVPRTPGTWNPNGYTPCQNQYGCSRR